MTPSKVHSFLNSASVRPLALTGDAIERMAAASPNDVLRDLRALGIDVATPRVLRSMMEHLAGDAAPDLQPLGSTTQNSGTPIQFLQNWLPGFVRVLTAARNIDDFVGIATAGNWEDEQVVQGVMERAGLAQPYGDLNNVPLASWNANYTERTVVRFEQGMQVGVLESARAARANINDAAEKRGGAADSLEIERNRVGFFGYNNGSNNTYGFLNDPNLPAYVNVTAGVWSGKTFLQITADIRAAVGALLTQANGLLRGPGASGSDSTPYTLALPTGFDNYLSVTSDFGNSVAQWLKETYPSMKVVTAPELINANGGASVFYLYADRIPSSDGSTDGGQTFIQIVPAKFKTLGVEQRTKGYLEDYTNATAGVMVKRPFLVVRRSGI